MAGNRDAGRLRGSLDALAGISFVMAAAVLLYGVLQGWASATTHDVSLRVGNAAGQLAATDLPAGASLVTPFQVNVPVDLLPTGAVVMVKLADALMPLTWGVAALCIGLLCREASHASTIFDGGVLLRVRLLRWALIAILVLPHSLRVWGSTWATSAWGEGLTTATPLGSVWLPLLGMYLCVVFEFVLHRGAQLQGELDEVI
ncbi:hypothetical protein ACTQ49_00280 [Luteococcus sp. Sow4_B9]|uniref:hypothetical protein n=1 Tax=Luteococcus sp. Sow4_B9 TaxID=3438792 RepID=UPI003F9925E4